MREFPTPERVFALTKTLAEHSYNRQTLYELLCMPDVFGDNSKNDEFGYSVRTAQELELIQENDGGYSLTVNNEVIQDYYSFRKYAAKTALSRTNTIYFKTTSLYIKLAESVLKCPNWGAVLALLNQNGMELTDNDMYGWRFWTSFFGIGYLHQQMLIPNCFIRFLDVIEVQESFKIGEDIPVDQFLLWLEVQCPEIKDSREGTKLGLAVSNGLRTLGTQHVIELRSQPDAYKCQLYAFESEYINDISHVRIMR